MIVMKFLDREEGGGNRQKFTDFNNKMNKHKIKAAGPHGQLDEERPRRERREREKNVKTKWTHCRLVNQVRGSHSRCHVMVLDIFGGRPNAPTPPGGRRWLFRSRVAGSESPFPCSSPNMEDGSRLWPPGKWGRLLCSLSDGSHPSLTQEHGIEPSVPPVLLLLQHHRLGQPLAVSASSCCPTSSAPWSLSAARALWQRVPPSSRVSAPRYWSSDREEGGNRQIFTDFNNNKHKIKVAARKNTYLLCDTDFTYLTAWFAAVSKRNVHWMLLKHRLNVWTLACFYCRYFM